MYVYMYVSLCIYDYWFSLRSVKKNKNVVGYILERYGNVARCDGGNINEQVQSLATSYPSLQTLLRSYHASITRIPISFCPF